MNIGRNSINSLIESLTDEIENFKNEIKNRKKIILKLPILIDTIKIERIREKSCTCYRCNDGLQICGNEINWVCGPIDKDLPIKVHSNSDELLWWFKSDQIIDNTLENEWIQPKWKRPTNDDDRWWCYGSTAEDAILEWLLN